jgi:hypothetical protein
MTVEPDATSVPAGAQDAPAPSAFQELMEWGKGRGYKLDWMALQEEGTPLATNGKGGFLLQEIDRGRHAEVPDHSDNLTGRPRGAVPRPNAPRVGNYAIRTKADIWLRNAAELYEEAIQRQWSSATDIPWEELKELPDDIERAECQLATFLTDVEFVAGDVPGKWIADTSPDYYEPRMFLLSQIMDEARHLDVFRKRALANGGGLMYQARGAQAVFAGNIDSARDFSEMSARLHISGEGLVLTIFRMGERMAYNEAERAIYRLAASDESRHVAFGVMHLQYLAAAQPDRIEEIQTYLDDVETGLVAGTLGQNPLQRGAVQNAALAVLLGGGKEHFEEGQNIALAMRQRQIKEYVQRVRVAGFGERFESGRANPMLEAYLSA